MAKKSLGRSERFTNFTDLLRATSVLGWSDPSKSLGG
jgi:hypothetical protein